MIEEKDKVEQKQNSDKDAAKVATSKKPETRRSSSRDERSKYRGRGQSRSKGGFFFRKKSCYFCKNKDVAIDYKDVNLMRRYIAESGKISPRRFTGTCAKHQRKLATEIKKARHMALIPFTDK